MLINPTICINFLKIYIHPHSFYFHSVLLEAESNFLLLPDGVKGMMEHRCKYLPAEFGKLTIVVKCCLCSLQQFLN